MNNSDHDAPSQALADRLARHADSIDLGPPVIDVVIGRGRQRLQRRRTAVGVTAVVGIAGASVVAIAALSRPADNGSIVAAPTGSDDTAEVVDTTAGSMPTSGDTSAVPPSTASTTPATVDLTESPYVWNRVDPDSTEAVGLAWGVADQAIAGEGPWVAWSTTPGRSDDYQPVLWRSDDGVRWQQVETDPSFVARNVAERNGTFFTFGTSPATVAERKSDLSIGTSTDGGLTWQQSVLPLDTSDLAREPGVQSVGVMSTSMATSAAGVLLSAQVNANVGLDTVLPPEYRNSVWEVTDAGIMVGTAESCGVTPTTVLIGGGADTTAADTTTTAAACESIVIPWAELGISERAAAAIVRPEVHLFLSTDGTTFQQVDAPTGFDADWTSARLTSFGDGFAALVTNSSGGTRLLSSADGRSWSDLGEVPLDWPESIDEWGGRLVLTGWSPRGMGLIAVRDAAGNWTTTDVRGLIRPEDGAKVSLNISHLVTHANGISMVGWMFIDPLAEIGGTSFTTGDVTVHIEDLNGHLRIVDNTTGEQLAEIEDGWNSDTDLAWYRPSAGIWDIRRDPDGEVIASFGDVDISRAIDARGGYASTNTRLLFLHSADGVTWSREWLDDLAGATVSNSGGFRVANGQLMLAVNLQDDRNPDGTPKQIVLVGTPRS